MRHPLFDGTAISALCLLAAAIPACAPTGAPPSPIALPITPYEVPSGAEVLRCEELPLPSAAAVDFDRVTWDFSPGNHHVHVYVATVADAAPAASPYDCAQAVDFEKWSLLVASQGQGSEWALPAGVAIHVEARRTILVQTHYLNTGLSKLVARGSVALHVAAAGSFERRAAAFFGENRAIAVPPHASGHVSGECALPGTGDLLAMQGHYHVHGRGFSAWLDRPGNEPDPIYDSHELSELSWVDYDGLRFGPGDRLGWSCDYDNDMNGPLLFGSHEATEEHCNLFAFFALAGRDAEALSCVLGAEEPE